MCAKLCSKDDSKGDEDRTPTYTFTLILSLLSQPRNKKTSRVLASKEGAINPSACEIDNPPPKKMKEQQSLVLQLLDLDINLSR